MAFRGLPHFIFVLLFSWASARDFYIRSDHDLLSSLNNARPGDNIHLRHDTIYYLQNVELTHSGHPHDPITLVGDRGTRISSDNTGLVVRGNFWNIRHIAFESSLDGLVVHGNNNTLKSLSFNDIDGEALVLRGSGNSVHNCVFNGVNHGVVIGGLQNELVKNSITSLVTTVTVNPKSCCGRLEANVFNGLLSVHGTEYTLSKNILNSDINIVGQRNNLHSNVINGKLDVHGCGNNFFGNTAQSSEFTSTCYNWDDGKNHFGKVPGNKFTSIHEALVG